MIAPTYAKLRENYELVETIEARGVVGMERYENAAREFVATRCAEMPHLPDQMIVWEEGRPCKDNPFNELRGRDVHGRVRILHYERFLYVERDGQETVTVNLGCTQDAIHAMEQWAMFLTDVDPDWRGYA
jgi:hypothetical protein